MNTSQRDRAEACVWVYDEKGNKVPNPAFFHSPDENLSLDGLVDAIEAALVEARNEASGDVVTGVYRTTKSGGVFRVLGIGTAHRHEPKGKFVVMRWGMGPGHLSLLPEEQFRQWVADGSYVYVSP